MLKSSSDLPATAGPVEMVHGADLFNELCPQGEESPGLTKHLAFKQGPYDLSAGLHERAWRVRTPLEVSTPGLLPRERGASLPEARLT